MGITKVKLVLKNPLEPSKKVEADFLVDSGAHYTVLPQKVVKKLGIKPSYEQEFTLADGRVVKRSIGSALVNFEGRELEEIFHLGGGIARTPRENDQTLDARSILSRVDN